MIRKAAIAAGLTLSLCGLATPSVATEWVNCSDAAGAASFSYLAGSVDALAIVGLNISAGDKAWASDVAYGPGEPAAVSQAFETSDTVFVDVMDPNMMGKIAELRLFKASEGEARVASGTLRIPGHGAWSVACTGP